MSEKNYRPSGDLQGDTKAIPDAGTSRGRQGVSDYGADLGGDSLNRMGGMKGTDSDPADQCYPSKAEKGRA